MKPYKIVFVLMVSIWASSCTVQKKSGCICDVNEWEHFLGHRSAYKEKVMYREPSRVYKLKKKESPKVETPKPVKVKKPKVKHHRHLNVMTKIKISYSKD